MFELLPFKKKKKEIAQQNYMNPQIFWKMSAKSFEFRKQRRVHLLGRDIIYLPVVRPRAVFFFLFFYFFISRKAGPRQRSIYSFRAGQSSIFQCPSTARAATTRCLKFYLSLKICRVSSCIYCTQIIINQRGPKGFLSFL